ncbi:MAG: preprotein translocase subunit SecG [Peptostreptococcaceae bacterium]|nr:preprotein translocase subunit SecG [Peptostreptococcaceae bacterium]
MKTALMVIEILVSLGLIASVLLQSGKSAGFSGTITGGAEQLMGNKARGLDVVFKKMTTVCAILFMVLAVVLVAIQN